MAFLCQSFVIYHTSDHRNALRGINIDGGKLDDCLAKVHQNIITVWNFEDKEKVRYLCDVMSNTVPTLSQCSPVRSSVMASSSD